MPDDKWFVIPTAEGWVMGYQLPSGGWYMAQQEAKTNV
jgi:hypothetical protein